MQDTGRSDVDPHHTGNKPLGREIVRVEYNLRGTARPLIALTAFVASFGFALIAYLFDSGESSWRFDWFVATPCMVGGLSCSLLFLRLLLGKFDPVMQWALIFAVFVAGRAAGSDWYLVVLLAGVAYLGMFLMIHFLVGDFTPVVRVTKRSCN